MGNCLFKRSLLTKSNIPVIVDCKHNGAWNIVDKAIEKLVFNKVDTICLNVPYKTITNKILKLFLKNNIIPHINIDGLNLKNITEMYVGETDIIENASDSVSLNRF